MQSIPLSISLSSSLLNTSPGLQTISTRRTSNSCLGNFIPRNERNVCTLPHPHSSCCSRSGLRGLYANQTGFNLLCTVKQFIGFLSVHVLSSFREEKWRGMQIFRFSCSTDGRVAFCGHKLSLFLPSASVHGI
jgi:hypothetical protein